MKIFQKFQPSLASILEYGVYFLVFLLPLQTRYFLKENFLGGEYWEYGSIALYLVDILIILLFILSIVEIVKKRRVININKLWIILAFFEFFVFLSIFFSDDKIISLYGYYKIILGIFLFFILTENKLSKEKIFFSFFSAVFFQASIGILQFFNNYSWANKYLGMAEHNPDELGTFVIELDDKTRVLRSYGGLDHPNIYSFLIFLGIFFFIKYLLKKKNRDRTPAREKIINYFILGVLFFSLLLGFSRSVYLVFFLYILFLLGWSIYDKNRRKYIYKIVFFFVVIFSFFFMFYSNLFIQRIDPTSRLENISNNERYEQVISSLSIIKENIFFGVGVGNYTKELVSSDNTEREAWVYQPVHNVFLLVLSEIGIFGLISFLGIIFYFLSSLASERLFFDIFLLLSILVIFTFDHWIWSLHFGILFFFFILSLIYLELSKNPFLFNKKNH